MPPPEPMLCATARSWPAGTWVEQPKWDGFRLLVEVDSRGQAHAWSRHGTVLTRQIADLLASLRSEAPAPLLLDGELVALANSDRGPLQDFSAVCRAVLRNDPLDQARLQFVAFDLLAFDGADLRLQPLTDRDLRLREVLPSVPNIVAIQSWPAAPSSHHAVVELGFEGTVLKHPSSLYRPGRRTAWRKRKAHHRARGVVRDVGRSRDGRWFAVCDVEDRRVLAVAGPASSALVGQAATVVYSRHDADGSLREARLAAH